MFHNFISEQQTEEGRNDDLCALCALLRNKIVVQPPPTYGLFTRRAPATETYEAPPLSAGRATRGEPSPCHGPLRGRVSGRPFSVRSVRSVVKFVTSKRPWAVGTGSVPLRLRVKRHDAVTLRGNRGRITPKSWEAKAGIWKLQAGSFLDQPINQVKRPTHHA